MQLEVGNILDGKVTGITAFGAFVALPDGKSGLIHISEVADAFVRDVHDYLSEQQEVKVKVIGISPEGKISLSLRQAEERRPAPRPPRPRPAAPQTGAPRNAPSERNPEGYVPSSSGDQVFEDKLKRFMQESDGKMSGNRLFQQQRKGQRRRK